MELVQAFDPFVPAFMVPHVKMPLAPPLTENVVKLPGSVSVTVTVLVLCVALMPDAAGHNASAAWRFWAKIVVVAPVANVPAVELEHVFVPLLPLVPLLQVKPLVGFVKVATPGFAAVTVMVALLMVDVKPTAE